MRYYHFDALGSTRLLTDSDGNITDEYTYDAWGKLMEHTGSTAQPYQFAGQLGYYSHYQDENLFAENGWQLLQLGVRFYDPEVGRFGQVDPLREGLSWLEYAHGRPTYLVDPSGKMGICGRSFTKFVGHCDIIQKGTGKVLRRIPMRYSKHYDDFPTNSCGELMFWWMECKVEAKWGDGWAHGSFNCMPYGMGLPMFEKVSIINLPIPLGPPKGEKLGPNERLQCRATLELSFKGYIYW